MSDLAALVAQWREMGTKVRIGTVGAARSDIYRSCADQLAQALADAPRQMSERDQQIYDILGDITDADLEAFIEQRRADCSPGPKDR